jgi:hypothetical protein
MKQWTIFFIFAFAAHNLVLNYGTVIFYEIDPTKNYNGFIDAAARLFGSATVLIPTRIEWTLVNFLQIFTKI